jgi:serine/threonine protein kinase
MDMRVSEIYFELTKEIGQEGLNSKTHIAKDLQLDTTIVIKQINKVDISPSPPYFTEARLLYASRHPNVMEIHYASQDVDKLYLAMPDYRNGSLHDVGFTAKFNWTLQLIGDYISREFGKSYSIRGISKLRHRMDLSYTKPTYTLAAADEESNDCLSKLPSQG